MPGLTYRDAGVDIDAGNELVRRIAPAVRRTRRPEMLSDLGGFAALAALPQNYSDPVLVTGTDGVGTKLRLAIDHGRHDDVGQDLVAMCVNDVLVAGAEPFLFLDYYASGALDVDVAERVINGIAKGCELAGCALAGGETAEMPGFYPPGDYDLAGFCVGVVERDAIVTGDAVDVGDVLIGLASSGAHANGYSLIRRILDDQGGAASNDLVDQLLAPTRIYVRPVNPVLELARGLCHITGGGFVDNLPRMFGDHLAAAIDLDAWKRPAVFDLLQQAGGIDEIEMLRTFNLGIGFVVCVAEADVPLVAEKLRSVDEHAHVIGRMVPTGSTPASGRLIVSKNGASLG
ncbi:MAG: phosphoribosylformylglycinamidine cyclo-ligase [Gammaproteobacteria bacterium]|nr:phosphoribosylformylglycinamidine cyclo-ligase [Gammaproteobacteria bacterium]